MSWCGSSWPSRSTGRPPSCWDNRTTRGLVRNVACRASVMRIVPHSLGAIPPLAPRAAQWDGALVPAILRTSGDTERLARLQARDALVVTTGQQPGLFTGPLY